MSTPNFLPNSLSGAPQSSVHALRERRKKLSPLSDKPLLAVRDLDNDKFNRFTCSPISPKAFPTSGDESTLSTCVTLLDRYLAAQKDHRLTPKKEFDSDKTPTQASLNLTKSGFGTVVPIQPLPTNSWAFLSESRSEDDENNTLLATTSRQIIHSLQPHKEMFLSATTSRTETGQIMSVNTPANVQRPYYKRSAMHLQYTELVRTVRFTRDDYALKAPPPAPTSLFFSRTEVPEMTISIGTSPFDPPPAPRSENFPIEFPASPRKDGPSPIDTALSSIKKDEISSAIKSPVPAEERTKPLEKSKDPPPAPTFGKFPVDFSPRTSAPRPIDIATASSASPVGTMSSAELSIPSTEAIVWPQAPMVADFPRTSPLCTTIKTVRFAHSDPPSLTDSTYSLSPPVFSPVTPIAMTFAFSESSKLSPLLLDSHAVVRDSDDKDQCQKSDGIRGRPSSRIPSQRSRASMRARTHSPPRSLRHDGEVAFTLLPATVYDPTKTLNPRPKTGTVYPSPLIPQYNPFIINIMRENDKDYKFRTYFHRSGAST